MSRKSKVNRKGRNEQSEHFAKLQRRMMETPAWRALSSKAQALYPWLLLEWHGPNFNQNGKLRLSIRQAAEKMNLARNTIAQAFHELQGKGFIVVTETACLGIRGAAKAPAYEMTDLPLPTAEPYVGRKLYLQWREGNDFTVIRHKPNNPAGFNGESKTPSQKLRRSHLKNDDELPSAVSNLATGRHQTCDESAILEAPNVINSETSLTTIPIGRTDPPRHHTTVDSEDRPFVSGKRSAIN